MRPFLPLIMGLTYDLECWCILRHKLRNGKNLPPWSQNLRNDCFLNIFMDYLGHLSTNLKPHDQNSFFLKFFSSSFSNLSYRMSRNMCKLRHKLRNAKKAVGPTFIRQNVPWFNLVMIFPFLNGWSWEAENLTNISSANYVWMIRKSEIKTK